MESKKGDIQLSNECAAAVHCVLTCLGNVRHWLHYSAVGDGYLGGLSVNLDYKGQGAYLKTIACLDLRLILNFMAVDVSAVA